MGVIYKVTNTITNKCYIGLTKKAKPIKRWHSHLHAISRGHGKRNLRFDVQQYGKEHFKFEIIFECPEEELAKNEIRFIQEYNSLEPNGYNISHGGERGSLNQTLHKEETKIQIKQAICNYFAEKTNIIKQREYMTNAVGVKVFQYDQSNKLINSFSSGSEAARQTGVCKATIQNGLKTPNQLRCGFYWRSS